MKEIKAKHDLQMKKKMGMIHKEKGKERCRDIERWMYEMGKKRRKTLNKKTEFIFRRQTV